MERGFKRRKSTLSQEIFPENSPSPQPPPKRLKSQLSDRRQDHVEDCSSPSCTGCAIGEIEFTFISEDGSLTSPPPPPVELYRMALDEVNNNHPDMAKRLFDLAIEGFEALSKEEKERLEVKREHAACLIEFGRFWTVKESIREGIEIFESIIEVLGTHKSIDMARVHMEIGKGRLALATLERKDVTNGAIDEDVHAELSKEEEQLYVRGIESIEKALLVLRPLDRKIHTHECIIAAKELHSLGTVIDVTPNRKHVKKIFLHALGYLAKTYAAEPQLLDRDPYVIGLFGGCLYGLATVAVEGSDEAKDLLDEAIEKLQKAVELSNSYPSHFETLGQALIMKSTISDDDDDTMEAFDSGVEALKRAYASNPENTQLRSQLISLGIDEMDVDEDDELEEEY